MGRIAALLLLAIPAVAQIGQFEAASDIGEPQRAGSARFDAASNEYTVSGGGANMWGARDAFHFVYMRIPGDVQITAEVRFPAPGGNPHRKAGFVVRQTLAAESVYADAVLHGDGLTSLQHRDTAGGETLEAKSELNGPVVLRLERRGDLFTLWAGKPGEPLQPAGPVPVDMKGDVYLGLAVCAHDPEAIETAVFSNVRIETGPVMKPFPMEWRGGKSAVDLSFLLDAPAGKHGFVEARNGHFVTGGRRLRFWGVNATAAATAPSKQDAPDVAAFLARFGINCVRFHFLDQPAPAGILARGDNTRALDPERMDRLDFFIAELKKWGIYADLNLNVARRYKAGDGVRDYELLGFAKALTYFDPRLLELQREYARQLLTHYNPYTKTEYRNEPAVAIVELVNENSIVEAWFSNRLLGEATRRNPGTWTDIPASYEKDLTARYHAWLAKRGLAPVPRLRREEFATAAPERFRTEAEFYMEMEDQYFQSMRKFLKEEIGVKAPVAATADHNHGNSGYPLLRSASKLDIVDGHTYWQHPSYTTDPATGRQTGFTIRNTPMVNDPANSSVAELSRSAVAGKPYTVSEVNHPFPSEYAAEGIPILAAYAAFQNWDGVFWYTLEHKEPPDWTPRITGHFDLRPDPVKMAQIAAGALVFLRGDVRPAGLTVARAYSAEQVIESLRLPRTERPYFTPGFPPLLPLVHASRIAGFDGGPAPVYPEFGGDPIVSDTRELAWHDAERRAGVVTVDTPRTQAIIGFSNANPKSTSHLAVTVENTFSAITLSSMDGKSLPDSSKLLLTAASRVANTGMRWNAARTTLTDWGAAPSVIEPVRGTVILRGIGAKSVVATPLDTAGRPLGPPAPVRRTAAGWEIAIGEPATTWYVIEPGRADPSPRRKDR